MRFPTPERRSKRCPALAYAIALTNQGKREAQRRFGPSFRHADAQLMELTAILLNVATGTTYPERGYVVTYPPIAMSPDELRALREQLDWELEKGVIDLPTAVMRLNQGMDRNQAVQELARIQGQQGVEAQSSGAKMQAATEIITKVSAGQMPRDAGVALLANLFGFTTEVAAQMMGSAGTGRFRAAV